jgi:uncharacterized protein
MPRPSEIYKFNTYELPRRAGEMKEYELDLVLQEPVGIPLISVPTAATIDVEVAIGDWIKRSWTYGALHG